MKLVPGCHCKQIRTLNLPGIIQQLLDAILSPAYPYPGYDPKPGIFSPQTAGRLTVTKLIFGTTDSGLDFWTFHCMKRFFGFLF